MKEDVYSVLVSTVRQIRGKSGMFYIHEGEIQNSLNYFQGFCYALDCISEKNLERELSSWFRSRSPIEGGNMNWFAEFKLVYDELSFPDQENQLFDLLEEFGKSTIT